MPFGVHSGKPLGSLPLHYLQWCIRTFKPGPLVDAMMAVVNERAKLTKSRIKIVPREAIKEKLTVQSILHHPKPNSIGEPFGELKFLIDNAPEGLF